MRIKTNYAEFMHKIDDAEFTLKEADIAQYSSGALSVDKDNKMNMDTNSILNNVIKACVLAWKNVVDEKDVDLVCNDVNKLKLSHAIKWELFSAIQKKSTLPEIKKKS